MGGYALSLTVMLVAPSIVHTAHTETLRSSEGSEHLVQSSLRNRAFELTDSENHSIIVAAAPRWQGGANWMQ
jgi:hypothetical protein